MTTALDLALTYISRGWNPVPLPFRSKVPIGEEWQKRIIEAATAADYFNNNPQNVGVQLGLLSHGLTDADLDCTEAIAIAPYLLPRTGAIFGRASKRASHWLYTTTLADVYDAATINFDDPTSKTRLLELRVGGGGKGAQTVFPGSVHESGELVAWEEQGEPAAVDGDDLLKRVKRIAAACLVARAWPAEGGRHNAALAVGGFLARAGLSEADVTVMMEAIARAASDEEWRDRVRAARDAVRHVTGGNRGAGLPTLAELCGEKAARAIATWLDYNERKWTYQGYTEQGAQPKQKQPEPGSQAPAQPQPQVAPQPPTHEQPAAAQPQPGAPQGPPWPELAPEALYGPAGDVVKTIEPETESDPVAILVQFHIYFGNAIGHGPYFLVESTRHYTNLFGILAGESSKSRKGTSGDRVRELFKTADNDWAIRRIDGGLSSGEGLIWTVRDPIYKMKDGQLELEDPGVDDKRFLADEREYYGILSAMKREGNILSRVMRDAFDGRDVLQTLTKHAKGRATDAHISVVGHITEKELREHLDHTSVANGFANRFLFTCVRRTKFLPEGGNLDPEMMRQLGGKVGAALNRARTVGRMTRTDEARKVWASVYRQLSEGRPGMFGAIIGRSEALTLRLSMLYALLDGCDQIDVDHLNAAVALWNYCEASARRLFGDALGNQTADTILKDLRDCRPKGKTRTELSDLFKRHESSAAISVALSLLLNEGKARFEHKTTAGRPTEIWFAT